MHKNAKKTKKYPIQGAGEKKMTSPKEEKKQGEVTTKHDK